MHIVILSSIMYPQNIKSGGYKRKFFGSLRSPTFYTPHLQIRDAALVIITCTIAHQINLCGPYYSSRHM